MQLAGGHTAPWNCVARFEMGASQFVGAVSQKGRALTRKGWARA
jgi:hypothetical protein